MSVTLTDMPTGGIATQINNIEEEKKAVKDYGSTDSGASLGDILGAALEAKSEKKDKKKTNAKKD